VEYGARVHEVLRLIEARAQSGSRPGHRSDSCRIALSIEGGGMRGTVSAGMALALHEFGLIGAFDAVYGASAGAITGAWLVSSAPEGLRGWADPDYARTLIRWSALLRGRPVVDVHTLVEVVYQTEFPMDFDSVLASPVEYHPLGTDAETGESTDLRPLIASPVELRLALRASASLPFLAGPPVALRGRRFYDAGVAESVPFRTPLAQGATHVLVLRSRRPLAAGLDAGATADDPTTGDPAADGPAAAAARPPRSIRLLTRTTLRNESLALRTALLTRRVRTAADIVRIVAAEAEGRALMVYPPPSTPPVSRLTTDSRLLAALESGREAVRALLARLPAQAAPRPSSSPSSATAGELVTKMTTPSAGAVTVSCTIAPSRLVTVPMTWPSVTASPALTAGAHQPAWRQRGHRNRPKKAGAAGGAAGSRAAAMPSVASTPSRPATCMATAGSSTRPQPPASAVMAGMPAAAAAELLVPGAAWPGPGAWRIT
jgi:predicted acylesterase/phospholipase RssA